MEYREEATENRGIREETISIGLRTTSAAGNLISGREAGPAGSDPPGALSCWSFSVLSSPQPGTNIPFQGIQNNQALCRPHSHTMASALQ